MVFLPRLGESSSSSLFLFLRLVHVLLIVIVGHYRLRRSILLALGDGHDDFELLAAEAAHRLNSDARLQLQQGLVDAAQVFHVERTVVDPFTGAALLLRRGPEELIQKVGHCPLAPPQLRQHGRGIRTKQCSAQRLDVQFGAFDALVEHAEQTLRGRVPTGRPSPRRRKAPGA